MTYPIDISALKKCASALEKAILYTQNIVDYQTISDTFKQIIDNGYEKLFSKIQ